MKPEPEHRQDDYEVEIVNTTEVQPEEVEPETGNIRKEGDPIGDNFA